MEPREKKQLKLDKKKQKSVKVYHQEESQSFKNGVSSPGYGKRKKLFTVYTKHGSYMKINLTYKEVLKLGFKWENIRVDICDFYLKCQNREARVSKPIKKILESILTPCIKGEISSWYSSSL